MGLGLRAFFLKRWGCDPGEIDLLPEGLRVEPPASVAKRLALSMVVGPAGTSLKDKAFTIPYGNIKGLRVVWRKLALLVGEKPFVEIDFSDQKGETRSLTFAPVKGIMAEYKSVDFCRELTSKVSEARTEEK